MEVLLVGWMVGCEGNKIQGSASPLAQQVAGCWWNLLAREHFEQEVVKLPYFILK